MGKNVIFLAKHVWIFCNDISPRPYFYISLFRKDKTQYTKTTGDFGRENIQTVDFTKKHTKTPKQNITKTPVNFWRRNIPIFQNTKTPKNHTGWNFSLGEDAWITGQIVQQNGWHPHWDPDVVGYRETLRWRRSPCAFRNLGALGNFSSLKRWSGWKIWRHPLFSLKGDFW